MGLFTTGPLLPLLLGLQPPEQSGGGTEGVKSDDHGFAHGRLGKEKGHGQGVSVATIHCVYLIGQQTHSVKVRSDHRNRRGGHGLQ